MNARHSRSLCATAVFLFSLALLAVLGASDVLAAPGNRAPRIIGNPGASVDEGSAYAFLVRGADPDGDSVTFAIANLPVWASFVDNGDGTANFAGTPGFGSAGVFADIEITVTDGALTASLGPFSIEVLDANRPPEIVGVPPLTAVEGAPWTFTARATDPDGDPLSFEGVNVPSWAQLVDNGDGSATVSGTPGFSDAGFYVGVTLRASDGRDSTSLAPFTLVVMDMNQPPVITGTPALSVAEGDVYSFTVAGSDPEGDALQFMVVNRPTWANLIDHGDGTATLTGTPGFTGAGEYAEVRVRVSDGQRAAEVPAFTITVSDTNRPPMIQPAAPPTRVPEGGVYSFSVTARDDDGDPLRFEVVRVPEWATFVDNLDGTGTLTGTPDFDSARVYRAVSISVTDGELADELESFPIEVVDVNRAPELVGTPPVFAKEDEVYTFIATATDLDGDALTFQLIGRPRWMSHVSDTTSITLTGVPSFDDAGVYENIRVEVSDGRSRTTIGPFSVTVEETNQTPEFQVLPTADAWHGLAYHADVAFTDRDGDPLVLRAFNLPSWLTLLDHGDGTAEIFGVPSAADIGAAPVIRLVATDGSGGGAHDFLLNVLELQPEGVPGVPSGIYALDEVIDRPWVSGVAVRLKWRDVEPVQGEYDFSVLTRLVRSAQSIGQAVTLVNLLRDPPDWLLATTETYVEDSGTVRIVPWDETMLLALESLIVAEGSYVIDGLAVRDHPTIKQVSSSLGGANSIRLQPAPPGYTFARYEEAVFRTLDAWAAAYPVGKHLYLGVFGIDAPNGFDETRQLRDSILSSFNGVDAPRMNFFQEVLTGLSPTPTGLGLLLAEVKDQTGILLQACGAWAQQDTIWERCNWIEPLDLPEDGFVNGFQYGSTYYEIYKADLENAAYDAQFEAWAEIIEAYALTIP